MIHQYRLSLSRDQVAMKACPYRKDFYAKLIYDPEGGDAITPARLDTDLDQWLLALKKIIERMQNFYANGKHDKGF